MSLSPQVKLSTARLYAVRRVPYFTAAIMALVPRETPGLGTIGVTERCVMLWDPAFVDKCTVQETAAVIIHEVGHVLRQHAQRCRAGGFDPERFNIAGDAEINDDIVAMGLSLPKGINGGDCIMPKSLGCADGLTAEEYYRSMPVPPPPPPGSTGGQPGQGPQAPQAGGGWCGSAGGKAVPGEPADGDPAGRSDQDVARIQQQTADAIREHQATHGQGSVPGGWAAWAEVALQKPRVPWEQKLARVVRTAVAYRPGAVDLRFSKMSRKQAAVGYGRGKPILPAMVAPIPRIMVAIDTSGSMGTKELSRAVSECQAIFRAIGGDIDFVACDSTVHADVKVRSVQDILKNVKGGGGTDFRPIFEAAQRKKPQPEICVFVTDGCGPAPQYPPAGMKTIWLLVGPYRQAPTWHNEDGTHGEVTWGETIEVDDDAETDTGDEET